MLSNWSSIWSLTHWRVLWMNNANWASLPFVNVLSNKSFIFVSLDCIRDANSFATYSTPITNPPTAAMPKPMPAVVPINTGTMNTGMNGLKTPLRTVEVTGIDPRRNGKRYLPRCLVWERSKSGSETAARSPWVVVCRTRVTMSIISWLTISMRFAWSSFAEESFFKHQIMADGIFVWHIFWVTSSVHDDSGMSSKRVVMNSVDWKFCFTTKHSFAMVSFMLSSNFLLPC